MRKTTVPSVAEDARPNERGVTPSGFDVLGAAGDHKQRALRWASLLKDKDLLLCYRLLTRNPDIAAQAARLLQTLVAEKPDGGTPPDAPLFP